MEGFDYFKKAGDSFKPQTPAAAFKAMQVENLPSEAFIYQSTSVKPLDEEPFDLNEIDRILTREDLDGQTNLLLMRIFEKLVKNPDSETALFAAEGINAIEGRYNDRIEALKKELEKKKDLSLLSRLAEAFLELSQFYRTVIKNFYLKEAYSYLTEIERIGHLSKKDICLLIKVLLDLKLYDQAKGIIDSHAEKNDPNFILLEAEIEFRRCNFLRVQQLCAGLFDMEETLDEHAKALIKYWLGF